MGHKFSTKIVERKEQSMQGFVDAFIGNKNILPTNDYTKTWIQMQNSRNSD